MAENKTAFPGGPNVDIPEELTANSEPDIPQWEVVPWTKELIALWSEDPAFKEHCQALGINPQVESPIGITAQNLPPEGLNIQDPSALFKFVMDVVQSQIKAKEADPTPEGMSLTPTDETQLVEFPDPKEVEVKGRDGSAQVVPMSLWPINYAQQNYSHTGYYKNEIANYLKKEIKGARFVKIPYEAAFVEHVFIQQNADGKTEAIRERFVGPGIFAYSSLADSLERQVKSLVAFTMPNGEIPGSQTTYDDLVTNGIRFVTGYRYLVPPSLRNDMIRRVRQHEEAYQSLGRQQGRMGHQGFAQLSAKEAQGRQAAGMTPAELATQMGEKPAGHISR